MENAPIFQISGSAADNYVVQVEYQTDPQ